MRVQEIVGMHFARIMQRVKVLSSVKLPLRSSRYIYVWDSVQLNHPMVLFQNFQNKQKKSNARIEMYG